MEWNLDARVLSIVIPLVTALVQALRQFRSIDDRPAWLPFLAIGVSGIVTAAAFATGLTPEAVGRLAIGTWILHSLVAGLAASGLYSAAGQYVAKAVGKVGPGA